MYTTIQFNHQQIKLKNNQLNQLKIYQNLWLYRQNHKQFYYFN